MKKVCLSLLMGLMVQMTFGQTLEKMQWFNEPEQWEIKNKVLIYISTLERLESENPRTKDDILCLYYRSYYICAVFTEKNDIMA